MRTLIDQYKHTIESQISPRKLYVSRRRDALFYADAYGLAGLPRLCGKIYSLKPCANGVNIDYTRETYNNIMNMVNNCAMPFLYTKNNLSFEDACFLREAAALPAQHKEFANAADCDILRYALRIIYLRDAHKYSGFVDDLRRCCAMSMRLHDCTSVKAAARLVGGR